MNWLNLLIDILYYILHVLFVAELIFNFSYYKTMPAFGSQKEPYEFKTIWHYRLHRSFIYLWVIYWGMKCIRWLLNNYIL